MKYCLTTIMLASSFLVQPVWACNMCGCSSENQYTGLLPQNNKSFIGLQYIYRSFSTTHPDEGNAAMQDVSREYYHTAQLWARVNIGRRWHVLAFVPYVFNRQQSDITTETRGPGDISVTGNYSLINTSNCIWMHKLFVGGGIKLPTGKYDPSSVTATEGLPNMQPGTHSWDFITDLNYTVRHKNTGINADASYIITTANPDSYKYGNRLSISTTAFYEYKTRSLSVIPQAGLRHDRAAKDYEDYAAREKDEDSGGWQLYATQGVQVYYKQFGFHAMCYEPVAQHYAGGMVDAKLHIESGIVWLMK